MTGLLALLCGSPVKIGVHSESALRLPKCVLKRTSLDFSKWTQKVNQGFIGGVLSDKMCLDGTICIRTIYI